MIKKILLDSGVNVPFLDLQGICHSLSLGLKISLAVSASVNTPTLSAESENPSSTGNRYKWKLLKKLIQKIIQHMLKVAVISGKN